MSRREVSKVGKANSTRYPIASPFVEVAVARYQEAWA